jgi:glycosyltransferase involved in cell wall biosynthesis
MIISVIIPTVNRPNLIGRSLKSVLNQTVKDLEVIVVDGSENDDTQRQIAIFHDKRINYIKIKNLSAAHSRNIGIRNATGDFVAFNDDDDIWNNHKLEKQIDFFKKDASEKVVYSTFSKKVGKKVRITPDKDILNKHGNIYNEVLKQNFVGLQTAILPLSCCKEIIFDEQLKCLEDWDWVIRLAKKYPFEFVEESLVSVFDTFGSLNKSNYYIKAETYKIIYSKHYSDIKLVPAIEAKHLLSIGNNLYLSGDIEAGRAYLLRSMRIKPKNPIIIFCYLLSFLGINVYRSGFKIFERFTHSQP